MVEENQMFPILWSQLLLRLNALVLAAAAAEILANSHLSSLAVVPLELVLIYYAHLIAFEVVLELVLAFGHLSVAFEEAALPYGLHYH